MNDDLRISPEELDAAVVYTIRRLGSSGAIASLTESLIEALLPSTELQTIAWLALAEGSDPQVALGVYVSGLMHGRASLHADQLGISLDELNMAVCRVNERTGGQQSVLSGWLKAMTRELMPSSIMKGVESFAIHENSDPHVAITAYIAGLLHGRASIISALPPAATVN